MVLSMKTSFDVLLERYTKWMSKGIIYFISTNIAENFCLMTKLKTGQWPTLAYYSLDLLF